MRITTQCSLIALIPFDNLAFQNTNMTPTVMITDSNKISFHLHSSSDMMIKMREYRIASRNATKYINLAIVRSV
jgi:hypothetical protein